MTPQKPYFPPPLHNIATIWRNKSLLVMTKQALLPNRCIKCNAPAERQLQRKLRWHHPALYLLIFGGVLFYVILALVIGKTATINVGLCEAHFTARRRDIVIGCALVLVSFISFYLAAVMEDGTFFLVGFLLFLGGVIYGTVRARLVIPQKIDDHYVWLNGVNASYLLEFPEWQGTR